MIGLNVNNLLLKIRDRDDKMNEPESSEKVYEVRHIKTCNIGSNRITELQFVDEGWSEFFFPWV